MLVRKKEEICIRLLYYLVIAMDTDDVTDIRSCIKVLQDYVNETPRRTEGKANKTFKKIEQSDVWTV